MMICSDRRCFACSAHHPPSFPELDVQASCESDDENEDLYRGLLQPTPRSSPQDDFSRVCQTPICKALRPVAATE